jgi:protease-4
MSVSSDWLLDRIRLKRKLRFWQSVAIVIGCGLLLIIGAKLTGDLDEDHIARLSVDGIIQSDETRSQLIEDLSLDDTVKAVIIRINSPGGTVVGGESLYRDLRKLADKKPLVATMEEVAASAGYMTALAADHIVAHEGTITGSIGVLMQSANITGLLDKAGIEPVLIKSNPLKAAPNPFENTSKQARAVTEGVIMDMYEMFVDMFAERRNLERDVALKLADGRIYTGRQALKAGLIDQTGSLAQALDWLRTEHEIDPALKVRDIVIEDDLFWNNPKSWIENSFFNNTLISKGLTLDGLLSVWQPNME